ncbi:MAG: flagellar hook-basal body complex protein, partial [Pseudomonadota bacterium]
MTLSSSLSAGVAGLQANASRVATISDNIANASTLGYKRADIDFEALLAPAAASSYTAGTVRSTVVRDIGAPGPIIASDSALDLAIAGEGFLPVTDASALGGAVNPVPFKMTTTGGFTRDAEGFLTTATGLALTGWRTTADGELPAPVSRDGPRDLEPVQVTSFLTFAAATTEADLVVNLPASATEAGGTGDPYTVILEYFDSLGSSRELQAIFTPQVPATGRSSTWELEVFEGTDAAAPSLGTADIVFDESRERGGRILSVTDGGGAIFDPVTGQLNVTTSDGPIDLFIGAPGLDTGITQLDGTFATVSISANGAPSGKLARLEFDDAGFLSAIYDSGAQVSLYQIPVVTVQNPNNLAIEDGQAFSITPLSGLPTLEDAGAGSAGPIEAFSRQESTVDIAREL